MMEVDPSLLVGLAVASTIAVAVSYLVKDVFRESQKRNEHGSSQTTLHKLVKRARKRDAHVSLLEAARAVEEQFDHVVDGAIVLRQLGIEVPVHADELMMAMRFLDHCTKRFYLSVPKRDPILDWPVQRIQVFLGGACGSTTWRRDIAMPFLEQHGISYFNPQVDDWHPELVAIEAQAKKCAQSQLFVIGNETRGLASLVEAAFWAGTKTPVVAAVSMLDQAASFDGEPASEMEFKAINEARRLVCDVLLEEGQIVATELELGLQLLVTLFKTPKKQPLIPSRRIRADFGACLASSSDLLQTVRKQCSDEAMSYKDILHHSLSHLGITKRVTKRLLDTLHTMRDATGREKDADLTAAELALMMEHIRTAHVETDGDTCHRIPPYLSPWLARDVWIQGPGKGAWLDDIVPELTNRGLSHHISCEGEPSAAQTTFLMTLAQHQCRHILVFISHSATCLMSMVMAAHALSKGYPITLVLLDVPSQGSQDFEPKMPDALVKDLNRARAYLQDEANRSRAPVFKSMKKAAAHVCNRLSSSA